MSEPTLPITGILIGGPADGQACRVVLGQPDILVPVRRGKVLATSWAYDPVAPRAVDEPSWVGHRYSLGRLGGVPATRLQFYLWRGEA